VQVASNEYFTAQEIAGLLKLSRDTVIRTFEKGPGVLRIGHGGSMSKRRYYSLRIPKEALDKFIIETRVS
jgi:hypothetical protein